MKKTTTLYWIFTGLLIPAIGIGSIPGVISSPDSVKIFTELGYPAYLVPFVSVARILALVVIFIPKFPRLKEWAYAGIVFDIVVAIYSQIAIGNPLLFIVFPLIALSLLLGSYFLYHKKLFLTNVMTKDHS
ncbi:MAG: DoxX family protein [Bacteroidetes bacterium]|nr:DoxX family protein [Bacteroidota bacterium]